MLFLMIARISALFVHIKIQNWKHHIALLTFAKTMNGNGAVWKGESLMNDTLKAALDLYGPEAQTLMVFEEMAELQKELCKHARGKDNREEIAEEIADVLIMLDQMMILHDCESLVSRCRELKIERLEQRIREMEGRTK